MIGPSHHALYGALHRRRLWLGHLSQAFDASEHNGQRAAWQASRARVESSYTRMLRRLSTAEHLGIQAGLPLEQIVDDTPIDSFLSTLSDELNAYQCNLLDLVSHKGADAGAAPTWRESAHRELEEVSLLWGRQLAQELRISLARTGAAMPSWAGPRSLRSVAAILPAMFAEPLLFRRRTDREVQYELLACPHRRPAASVEGANLACRLDSRVVAGFVQALFENTSYRRQTHAAYCVDELALEPG